MTCLLLYILKLFFAVCFFGWQMKMSKEVPVCKTMKLFLYSSVIGAELASKLLSSGIQLVNIFLVIHKRTNPPLSISPVKKSWLVAN